jgi:TonB family protein
MKSRTIGWPALCLCALLAPVPGWADFYSAVAASEKKDFANAFELYRELAELGHSESQEMLAVMYVNGEGVKRDNVLGYAWAAIAMENGGGEAAKGIIAQLEPYMTAATRQRVAEVQAKFGKAAIQERLLPTPFVPGSSIANPCRMRAAANPEDFYPADARSKDISGTVVVEATVAPDGRARDPRVWYSLPAKTFDVAGRQLAMHNQYAPPRVNGVAVSCVVRFRVKFDVYGPGDGGTAEQKRVLVDARAKAETGDPVSQLMYGLVLEMRADMNKDKDDPMSWIVKAAQGGLASAQYVVGMRALTAVGQGTEKDDRKGLFWLQLAADAGQSEAQASLANYLLRNNPDAGAFDKALALLEKSAASGNRDGKFHLAALLATAPDAARRNPAHSLELLEQVASEVDFDPTYLEVRAAAHAMLGKFAEAQADQKGALAKAKKLGWDLTDVQVRLASYAASRPWTGNLFAY